jgi:hypothetical protein
VLYLRYLTHDASPKAISGRTSYLQVRLAYHLYPQLIPQLCNVERFGPPRALKLASPWPWVAHLVSCLIPATVRPIQTRFRYGFGCNSLNLATKINSQAHSPKGTPSGIMARCRISTAHRPIIALRLIVSLRFQVLFHSPHRGTFHLSLTVLVHYRSSSVFSLGEWTPQLPTGLACPVVLRIPNRVNLFSLTGLSPSMVGFPTPFC